jgi:hypothetical protein
LGASFIQTVSPDLQNQHTQKNPQGPEGVYTYTTAHQRKEDCLVCGSKEVAIDVSRAQTLAALIDSLKADPQVRVLFCGWCFCDCSCQPRTNSTCVAIDVCICIRTMAISLLTPPHKHIFTTFTAPTPGPIP